MHVSQGFKVIGHRGNAGRGQADDAGHGINLKPAIGVAADDTVGHWCAFWIGGRNSANHGAVSAVFKISKAVAGFARRRGELRAFIDVKLSEGDVNVGGVDAIRGADH